MQKNYQQIIIYKIIHPNDMIDKVITYHLVIQRSFEIMH